ncbi:hypothetical protein F751_2388 [Auxenochlorella protothecoides]|uniref:Pre-rRNA-processing protein RIX1 N-terminal domain-containing protein n=1 Tax=Auxenochlorella protothecoides TaxID=3075 RepID=A0A087SG17_AUXPR|nr:hypothetical protein F751_2388 [Auxenochlorella protothecoides]KFM24671.1 hypothetical protein F751_2388 [Auxenochlorella protothecoides]
MSLLDEVFQQAVQASTTDSLALETACKQLNLLAPGLSRVSAGAVDKFAQRVGKGVGTPASKTKGTGSRAAHFRAAALLAAECGAPAFSAGLADWVAAAHAAIRAAPWDEDVAPAWRLAATIAARVERSQDSTLGLARAAAPLLSRLAPLAARCLAENGGHPATLCALRALAAVQRALPQSLRQQAGDLRAALGAALTDAALPRPVWLAVARCWALLPASPGAAADWAAAMQTLLASAHDLLGVLYAGLEAEAAVKEARSLCDPSAATLPGLPGGVLSLPAFGAACDVFVRLLVTAGFLLRSSFPVAVPLPLRALLALARRTLALDDALLISRPGVPLTKAAALCRGLAPMHAGALGLVREAFYGAARALASVGGVALAADFGPSLLAAVAADAYGAAGHAGPVTGGATATRAAPATVADAAGSRSLHQRVDLCAAALDALGSLLAGCGHALASDQRDRGATLRALRASVLSPRLHRPPFLPAALDALRRCLAAGGQDPGLRALARDALLAGATEGGSGGAPMELAHPDGSSEFGDGQGLEGPAAGAHALARQAQQVLGGPGDFAVTVAAREVREAEKRGPPEESGAAEEVAAKRPATAGTTGPAASAPQRAAEPAPRGLSAPKTLPLEPASDSDDGSLPDIDSGSSDEGA